MYKFIVREMDDKYYVTYGYNSNVQFRSEAVSTRRTALSLIATLKRTMGNAPIFDATDDTKAPVVITPVRRSDNKGLKVTPRRRNKDDRA